MKRSLGLLVGALLALGCGKKGPVASADDARQYRDTAIVLEKCDVAAEGTEKIDADGDGRAEIMVVKQEGKDICRTVDLNFDGHVDRTAFFDGSGEVRRTESDYDRDGRVDEIAVYEAGELKEKYRATTMDGKLDTWEFFEKGKLARTERDENGDGIIDQWWEYPKRGCPLIHVDVDGDGRPDPGASIDYCKETGYVPPPVEGEDDAEKPAVSDFGERQNDVEELSNEPAEGSEDAAEAAEEGAGE